jgi:hypothetical protein
MTWAAAFAAPWVATYKYTSDGTDLTYKDTVAADALKADFASALASPLRSSSRAAC